MSTLRTILYRGLFDRDGRQHREVELRSATGHFEAHLADLNAADPGAISHLLAESLVRVGGYDSVSPAMTAALSRGDRNVLLLEIRRSICGDRLQLIVRCPSPSCREEADVDLTIADLCPDERSSSPEVIESDTPWGRVVIREPTGADDQWVGQLPAEVAAANLWSRLVVDLFGKGMISSTEWTELAPPKQHAVAVVLAEGRSDPRLAFAIPCPTCRAWMEIEIDPATLLATELGLTTDRLFAEVHAIAFHYHWSEDSILSMARDRRWRYLELLRRQLSGRPLME